MAKWKKFTELTPTLDKTIKACLLKGEQQEDDEYLEDQNESPQYYYHIFKVEDVVKSKKYGSTIVLKDQFGKDFTEEDLEPYYLFCWAYFEEPKYKEIKNGQAKEADSKE